MDLSNIYYFSPAIHRDSDQLTSIREDKEFFESQFHMKKK